MDKINPFTTFNDSNNDLDSIKTDLKSKHGIEQSQGASKLPSLPQRMDFKGIFDKKKSEEISLFDQDIDRRDVYKQVGDELIPKYDMYFKGIDNNELYAQNQSAGEKWANGLSKLAQKTGTAVLGGTVGSITGLFNAISEGSLSALYTDEFNSMLDEYNEKLDYKLPNYYAEEERDMGFMESLSTANFWANDFTGGLSFTLGAIVSEGIWGVATGGTSLIAKGALGSLGRWSTKALGKNNALKGLAKWKEPTKKVLNSTAGSERLALGTGKSMTAGAGASGAETILSGANTLNKGAAKLGASIPKALNQARFIYTSAGYEAGVESRHYLKEIEDEWLMDFQEKNGRMPDKDELYDFYAETQDSGNAVWLANLALVGSSNMAIFGKMLLGKSTKPAISNSKLKKELFGVGYTMEKGTAKAVQATKAQKITGKAYSILRAPVIEGVYEEGGQSVASSTVKDHVLGAFNEENTETNLGLIDSLIEGFKQTYGTKEGRKEVGLGMLIGLFGGGIATGGRFNDISQERSNIEQAVNYRNEFTPERILASQIMANRMMTNNRILNANKKQEEARGRGDLTGEFLSEQQSILASIERDATLQGLKQGVADFEAYLNTVNDTELAEELDIDVSEVAEWKETKLNDYRELSNRYQENESYVRALIGDQNFAGTSELNTSSEQIIKAITYNITLGEQSKEFTKKLIEDIKTTIGAEFSVEDVTSALDVDMVLAEASNKAVNKFMALDKRHKKLIDQRTALENELISAQHNTNPTNPETHAAKLNRLQGRINDLATKIEEINQEKDTAFRALGIQNEFITREDLDTQAQRVKELQETIEGYKSSNPGLYTSLTKLFDEYNKSKSNTVSFHNLTKELLDPKIRVKTINGWLSGLLNKNKSLDDYTKEFFRTQLENYETNSVQGKIFSGEAVDRTQTEEEEEVERGDDTSLMVIPDGDEMTPPSQGQTPQAEVLPVEKLKKIISDTMKEGEYTTSYIGDNYEEAIKTKPSQEDLDRYEELLNKVNSKYISNYNELMTAPEGYFKRSGIETGLNEQELNELKELQTKLSNWKVLQGSLATGGDSSIADLIFLIEQLETKVEKENTKQEVTTEEYGTLKQATDRETKEKHEVPEAVQSPDQVVVQPIDIRGEAFYSFSHLDIETLLRLFPDSSIQAVNNNSSRDIGSIKEDELNLIKKQEGQEFVLTSPNGTVKITVGNRSRLNISMKDLDATINNSNIAIVKYGTGGFLDVYEKLSNGDLVPLQGDFNYSSALENEVVELLPEVINNIKEGQTLTTRVNRNDSYNKALLTEYENSEKTEDDLNKLMNNLHIYITDQSNNVVGSLRAFKNDLSDTSATKSLLELRRKAASMTLDTNNASDYFGLNEVMPVRTVLVGSPNYVVSQNESGEYTPQSIEFTDTALEKVKDVGYFEGETLKLGKLNSEEVIKTFLPKESSTKMPIVVIEVNGKDIVFPVSLLSTEINRSGELDAILNTELEDSRKTMKVNELLINNGLNPKNYTLADESNPYNLDLDRVREDLSNIREYPNVEDWLQDSYNIDSLKQEATIAIDLDNKPFNLSKVILDLGKTRTIGEAEQIRNKYDNLENREIELRTKLQSNVGTILDGMNDYPDVDDVRWTDVLFSDNELYRNPETDVERRHNVNLLRDALYRDGKKVTPPKAVREAYGDDFINTLREQLEELDEVIEFKNKTRAAIKNSKLKNQKNNQNTKC